MHFQEIITEAQKDIKKSTTVIRREVDNGFPEAVPLEDIKALPDLSVAIHKHIAVIDQSNVKIEEAKRIINSVKLAGHVVSSTLGMNDPSEPLLYTALE